MSTKTKENAARNPIDAMMKKEARRLERFAESCREAGGGAACLVPDLAAVHLKNHRAVIAHLVGDAPGEGGRAFPEKSPVERMMGLASVTPAIALPKPSEGEPVSRPEGEVLTLAAASSEPTYP